MYKVTKRDCPMFGIGPYVCEFICDTASDISTLPTSISEGTGGRTAYDNQKCASGSIANVASGSESKQYMLNNQDIWCPYSVTAGSSSGGSGESSITVDFALSETSENPVANKTITTALNNKADTTHTHTANEVGADASGSAASALVEAKAYTDSEIADAMAENQTAIEALNTVIGTKANKTDIPDLSPYAKTADVPNIKVNAAVNADTVGGHSVGCDVPADAKFTDTIPDLSPYAKKTDVPNIKVNAAVNADKINGLTSDNFRRITKNTLNSLPIQPTGEGDYFVIDSTGTDFPYAWGYMSIRYGSSTNEFVATFQSTGFDNKMYINTYRGGWLGWKEISTTPIKYATFSANADGTGNFNLWTPSENKIPIAIQLDNKPFSVVLFLYNNQTWLGSTINEITRQPVTDTAVSGTVYYIEV